MKLKKYISVGTVVTLCGCFALASCSKNELDGLKMQDDSSNDVVITTGDPNGNEDARNGGLREGGGGEPNGGPTIGDNEDLGESGSTTITIKVPIDG